MKKIIGIICVAIASVFFVSCGDNTEKKQEKMECCHPGKDKKNKAECTSDSTAACCKDKKNKAECSKDSTATCHKDGKTCCKGENGTCEKNCKKDGSNCHSSTAQDSTNTETTEDHTHDHSHDDHSHSH